MRNCFVLALIVNTLITSSCTKQNHLPPLKPLRPFSWGIQGTCATLDSLSLNDPECLALSKLIESALTRTRQAPDGTIEVLGGLAEAWEFENPRKAFIRLKSLKWSNGAPLQAQHLINRWMRVLSQPTAHNGASLLFNIRGARLFSRHLVPFSAVGIHSPDPMTLVLELEVPDPSFFASLSHPALSAEYGHRVPLVSPTLGQYKIETISKRGVTLVPNPFSPLPTPPLEKITVSFGQKESQLRDSFLEGNTHFLEEAQKPLTGTDSTSTKLVFPSASNYFLVLNPRKKVFLARSTRRALMQSLQREEIHQLLKWDHRLTDSVTKKMKAEPVAWIPKTDISQSKKQIIGSALQREILPLTLHYPDNREGKEIAENIRAQWAKSLGLTFELVPQHHVVSPLIESDFTVTLLPVRQEYLTDLNTLRPLWEKILAKSLPQHSEYIPFEASLLPWNGNAPYAAQALEEWLVGKEYFVLPMINLSRTVHLNQTFSGLSQDLFFIWNFSDLETKSAL